MSRTPGTTPATTTTDAATTTSDRTRGRSNPWAQTFLTPVPIAFAVGMAGTALLGAIGVPGLGTWQSWLTGGLVLMFLMGAIGRLIPNVRQQLYAMVPPALPRPELIVAATGVLETAGALGLLVPATHRLAAICLALLLIAVFPANVHAARGIRSSSPLLPRTVEQLVFLGACLAVAFA
jgi:uncharacterized membrane protein